MTLSAAEVKNARIVPALPRAVTAWMIHFVEEGRSVRIVLAFHKIATALMILSAAEVKSARTVPALQKTVTV